MFAFKHTLFHSLPRTLAQALSVSHSQVLAFTLACSRIHSSLSSTPQIHSCLLTSDLPANAFVRSQTLSFSLIHSHSHLPHILVR
jgi:hypothetical protein